MITVCQNCDSMWGEAELKEIKHLEQRIGAGDTAIPVGECPDPECGALCHDVDDINKLDLKDALIKAVGELLEAMDADIYYDTTLDSDGERDNDGNPNSPATQALNEMFHRQSSVATLFGKLEKA